jgi:epsilon-lactone hydrolase
VPDRAHPDDLDAFAPPSQALRTAGWKRSLGTVDLVADSPDIGAQRHQLTTPLQISITTTFRPAASPLDTHCLPGPATPGFEPVALTRRARGRTLGSAAMVTPELEAVRAMIRARRPDVQPDLATRRADMDRTPDFFEPVDGVVTEDLVVAGRPARWYRPEGGDTTRALLYLHGGAYVSGSLESHRELCARLALACAAPVLALDYRLAPEHPFPAAVEDAAAAWTWLVVDAGYESQRLAIAGDSAGGGLTMATLLSLRDSDLPLPAAAALLSPWVDLACRGSSHSERAELEPMLRTQFLRADAARYAGTRDVVDPRVSPVGADLSDLPPVLITVGTDEILFDDAVTLHERIDAAGGQSRLEVWPDMFHVFQGCPLLPEAHDGMRQIGEFVTKHTT